MRLLPPRMTLLRLLTTSALVMGLSAAPSVHAASAGPGGVAAMLEESPHYGIYYDAYEPTFYTGFAPRTLDPRRLHIHIGRGDQIRMTEVLSDDVLAEYARDLVERDKTYRRLVDEKRMTLTQNHGLDQFEKTLADAHVAQMVAEEGKLAPDAIRKRNLELLERLNPRRVFRIHMPVDELIRRWLGKIQPGDAAHMDSVRQLELINFMLPTRLFVSELDSDTSSQLAALVQRCQAVLAEPASLDRVRPAFLALLEHVSHGIYTAHAGALEFVEFTAIHPIGTLNATTKVHGRDIPEYPTPGRRALTTHQRTLTNDHVPTDLIYSYSPWLPYIHIGTRMHDALHTLFWRMRPPETSFLPPAWREAKNPDGKPYEYLWLLSRGPMSHGCTHVNAGHIAELRQMLPAEAERLSEVDVFYNKAPLYDVFDIDGDFTPEVMGVKYYIAFSLKNDRPDRLRVRNERHAYYDWLYAGELSYDASGRGVFSSATDGRFIGRSATEGHEYQRIALYEADYEPEKIQFYHLVDIPFAQELRRVGAHHPFIWLGSKIHGSR